MSAVPLLRLGWAAVLLFRCGGSAPPHHTPTTPDRLHSDTIRPERPYTAFAAEYWYTYTDESQLVGKIGTEARFGQFLQPALPITDFYDVAADPAVPMPDGTLRPGQVLRYLGGPQLNSYPVIVEALSPGLAGNSIRIETSAPTSGNRNNRKWTVKDHPTSPTVVEVFDELNRRNLEQAINGVSKLVRIAGPMNTRMIRLPGGPTAPFRPGQVNSHALSGGTMSTRARLQFGDNTAGRTAIYGVRFGEKRHIWLRTFLRFSPNWQIHANAGGAGSGSHKLMFVRYAKGSRAEFVADGGVRSWQYEVGGGLAGGTVVLRGRLPWHNVKSINELYGMQGWPWPDLYNDHNNPGTFKMFKAACQPPKNPYCGEGTGEWYEIIWHLKVGTADAPERIEMTQAMRQYTVGGVKHPLPWRFATEYKVASPGSVWSPIVKYEQGVNRNRQWDEPMWMDWAFYEIVDGEEFPNPWGLPGG